jgi:hypothetical protein
MLTFLCSPRLPESFFSLAKLKLGHLRDSTGGEGGSHHRLAKSTLRIDTLGPSSVRSATVANGSVDRCPQTLTRLIIGQNPWYFSEGLLCMARKIFFEDDGVDAGVVRCMLRKQ